MLLRVGVEDLKREELESKEDAGCSCDERYDSKEPSAPSTQQSHDNVHDAGDTHLKWK